MTVAHAHSQFTYNTAVRQWLLCGLLCLTGTASALEQVAVTTGSPITYLANSSDPGLGTSWTAEAFDDSGWATGQYGIGFETGPDGFADNLLTTTVPPTSFSVYTRSTFSIADINAISSVFLAVDYDDGFVIWLNGTEIMRSSNIRTGPVEWDIGAIVDHESSNSNDPKFSELYDISSAALGALHTGTNVLAMAIFNKHAGSDDLVLAPQLTMNTAVTRGPYLQSAAPDSIRIIWRTNTAVGSRVAYGDAPGNLTSSVSDATPTTEHNIHLTGLQPDTTYYYSIGTDSATLAGGNSQHYFVTPPLSGTAQPTRIWVLGDSGDSPVATVRHAYEEATGTAHTDLWLMLGDNAYDFGTDAQYQAYLFDMFPEMLRVSPLWPSIGNHDGDSSDSATQTGPYFDSFDLPTAGEAGGVASGTEAYYSFDYGNIHFIVLDSDETDNSAGSAAATWLQLDLADTTEQWIIAYWHHPPHYHSDPIRQDLLPMLEAAGVDLVLSGHEHIYRRSFLLDGHYGDAATLDSSMIVDGGDGREDGDGAYKAIFDESAPYRGTVYSVVGSSSRVETTLPGLAIDYTESNNRGSMILEVDGNRLDATFLNNQGVVLDYFAILKTPDNCPLVSNPGQLDTDGDGAGDDCDDFPTDPNETTDTDGDGTGNNADTDDDDDGLDDSVEIALGTDPLNPDTDGDGLPDGTDPLPLLFNYADGDLAPLGAPDMNVNGADLAIMLRIVTNTLSPTDVELQHGDLFPPGAPDGQITLPDMLEQIKLFVPAAPP